MVRKKTDQKIRPKCKMVGQMVGKKTPEKPVVTRIIKKAEWQKMVMETTHIRQKRNRYAAAVTSTSQSEISDGVSSTGT
ncbi:hypothetical protein OK32_001213 [Salmonella enterica subsp. enterica]|nr:hypothetical protein [Salmonella enterica subsp. enterica serovar Hvittingfoss]